MILVAVVAGCSDDGDAASSSTTTVAAEDRAAGDFVLSPAELKALAEDAADCARRDGVSVSVTADGAMQFEGEEEAEAVVARCSEEVGLTDRPQPNAEQSAAIYELYIEQQECIEAETGLDLDPPPSRQTYLGGKGDWSPEIAWERAATRDGMAPEDEPAALDEVLEACPRP